MVWRTLVSCGRIHRKRERESDREIAKEIEISVHQRQTEAVATNANIMANVSEIFHR